MPTIELRRRRTLILALAISALAHSLVFSRFGCKVQTKLAGPIGVIDVQLIEPVSHHRSGSKDEKSPAPAEKTLSANRPSSNEVEARVSDPAQVTRLTQDYILQVMRLVAKKRIYPSEALEREHQGKVMVAVTVDQGGLLIEAIIEEKSPFESLDQAALATVRAVGQFPPLPAGLEAPLHLHIPLSFRIER